MSYLEKLQNESNFTFTENGALTNQSTKNALLDFFSMGGALRTRSEEEIINLFRRAFIEDKLLALKALFYFRDARGGQGERRTFRIIINWLDKNYNEIIEKNKQHIPFYGRWDDMYSISNPWDIIKDQLNKDGVSEYPSLLAKWLKSENATSKESKRLGRQTRRILEISSRQYRKMLSELRKKIDIVEKRMSENQWSTIQYEKVPSRASMIYAKAFKKHDETRYNEYIEQVKSGEKKINASVLYPYDIANKILNGERNDTLDVLWENLPNYIEGEENSIVVADVSGSMSGLPMAVSISLAIYFAEKIKGPFANHFITFSSRPTIQQIKGDTISDKVHYLRQAEWHSNTDLQAVFDLLLMTAVKNNIKQNEMIDKIYIISDMEFDDACYGKTNFDVIKQKYEACRYEMPKLVFWNVSSRNNQTPVTIDDNGVFLVSGCSPVIFKNLMKSKAVNAYDLMLDVLNGERYQRIVI